MKVGDKVRPKKDRINYCNNVDIYLKKEGTYLEITGINGTILRYNIKDKNGNDLGYCNCYKESDLEPIKKGGKMSNTKKLFRKLVNPDVVKLTEAEFLTESLELTDKGKDELMDIVFNDNKLELVKRAQEVVKEQKEDK